MDCSMKENFPVHVEAVNVKPSHIHPFSYSFFTSFYLLLYIFLSQNRESLGLRRITLTAASPVFLMGENKTGVKETLVSTSFGAHQQRSSRLQRK